MREPRATMVIPAGRVGAKPAYVERGGDTVYRPPAQQDAVRMYGFAVHARQPLLSAFCDRTFNRPTNGLLCIEPASDWMLLSFSSIGRVSAASPPDSVLGGGSYREVMLWFPVVDERRGHVRWAIPYMFVDRGAPMSTGREVFGFPKQLARVLMTSSRYAPECLSVFGDAIEVFGPDAELEPRRLIEVRSSSRDPVPLVSLWPDAMGLGGDDPLTMAARDIPAAGTDALQLGALLGSQALSGHLDCVLLKQFRDCADPSIACYQAVVEVRQTVTALERGGSLPGDWSISFADTDTHPLCRDMGLRGECRAEWAFWLDYGFRTDPNGVLWESTDRGR